MLLLGDHLLHEVLSEQGPSVVLSHDPNGILHQGNQHEGVLVGDLLVLMKQRTVWFVLRGVLLARAATRAARVLD